MKNTLIVILGPTCVGKTDVSVTIARHFRCEIISADSRQFYREMKIGTSVPEEDLLSEIRHHFIRFIDAEMYYSASLFERDVLKILPEIFKKNYIVLMTGGSGMYIDAVCNGIDDIPDVDPAIRGKYLKKYKEDGIASLRIALKILDPDHYENVDLKNPKRIIRALEISETTGRPYSSFLTKQKQERDFRIIRIGLERPRDELYKRINNRVDVMIEKGLEDEARGLLRLRHMNALQSVGYREFFDFFEGKISREKAIELIKRNTRRYAKRQMTWWARDKGITWFNAENVVGIIGYIESYI
jgi:tRNA dimethylallyltransferase